MKHDPTFLSTWHDVLRVLSQRQCVPRMRNRSGRHQQNYHWRTRHWRVRHAKQWLASGQVRERRAVSGRAHRGVETVAGVIKDQRSGGRVERVEEQQLGQHGGGATHGAVHVSAHVIYCLKLPPHAQLIQVTSKIGANRIELADADTCWCSGETQGFAWYMCVRECQ